MKQFKLLDFSAYWSIVNYFSSNSIKTTTITTFILSIHSNPHQLLKQGSLINSFRKQGSADLAHFCIIYLWLGVIYFHCTYLSNYSEWLEDPLNVRPSAQFILVLNDQDILNNFTGTKRYRGIYLTSGIYSLLLAQGVSSAFEIKLMLLLALDLACLFLFGSYIHLHVIWICYLFKRFTPSLFNILLAISSLFWSGHQVHIASLIIYLLNSGISLNLITSSDILTDNFYNKAELMFDIFYCLTNNLNSETGAIFPLVLSIHHLFIGLFLTLFSVIYSFNPSGKWLSTKSITFWNSQLALGLANFGSLSIITSHHKYSISIYPFIMTDLVSIVGLFNHHIWIGGLFICGIGAHLSISTIFISSETSVEIIFIHSDIILSYLIWVSIFLGFHSFGLFIHNDSLQAFAKLNDLFSDSSIVLKPVLANFISSELLNTDIIILQSRIVQCNISLSSSDFLVHHIHAFTIHVATLILVKSSLYSKSSRFVSDKIALGFRYACDGPGRGGSCQISPWDHVFLGLFWVYNSCSVVNFHIFWKIQSDVLGSVNINSIQHYTSGDFSLNSNTINGWLRNFLWSQASQVVSSYGLFESIYGLIFLGSHFIWALSLMFLFSGRGYWEELIESIIWAHNKLKLASFIQPRALSINAGRGVGITHFLLGGISCSWSFISIRCIQIK